ncbi:MAG: hypothetical protein AABY92_09735, partial [Thermodesulfobacteriota bacterium]
CHESPTSTKMQDFKPYSLYYFLNKCGIYARNLHVLISEGFGPADAWLKYWHRRETRRPTEKTNYNRRYLEKPVYSTQT